MNAAEKSSAKYKLYGTSFSYYTGKVRAYLNFKQIPYDEILSSLKVYKKIIIPRTGVRFIPIVITPDDQAIQDTSDIIDQLELRFPQIPIFPERPKQRLVALLFELFGDEWMLLPAMHYRWHFHEQNYKHVINAFGQAIFPGFPGFLQRFLAKKIATKFSGLRLILGINNDTTAAIEARYEQLLALLNKHFAVQPFLLGDRPSIGDFAMMGPLYGHLYQDPYPKKMMQEQAPLVAAWVERMNSVDNPPGQFMADDQIPETILPVIAMIFEDYLPVVQDTVKQLASWLEQNPGKDIPRSIGEHRFKIGEAQGQRGIFPNAQWMFQRPLDFYQALEPDVKQQVDVLLQQVGGFAYMQTDITHRVKRLNNHLVRG